MTKDNSYSIKEFIEEKFTDVNDTLQRIESQTLKTNGRVTSLEKTRTQVWTAILVLIFIGGTVIGLAVMAINDKIKDGITNALSVYEKTIEYED